MRHVIHATMPKGTRIYWSGTRWTDSPSGAALYCWSDANSVKPIATKAAELISHSDVQVGNESMLTEATDGA